MTLRIVITAALGLAVSTALVATASAQSYNAPAGIPAAAAPGGLEGRAALPNFLDAGNDVRRSAPRGYADDTLVTGSVRGARGDIGRNGR